MIGDRELCDAEERESSHLIQSEAVSVPPSLLRLCVVTGGDSILCCQHQLLSGVVITLSVSG